MKKRSRWVQFLVLLVGGPVLAAGGCALFLNTLNFNGGDTNAGQVIGAIGFIIGMAMLAIGALWGFVVLMMKIFKSDAPAPGTSTPAASGTPEPPAQP